MKRSIEKNWTVSWEIEDDATFDVLLSGYEELTATNPDVAKEKVYEILEDMGYVIGSSNTPYNVGVTVREVA